MWSHIYQAWSCLSGCVIGDRLRSQYGRPGVPEGGASPLYGEFKGHMVGSKVMSIVWAMYVVTS